MSAARQTGGVRWGVAVFVAFSIRSARAWWPHVVFDPQDATVLLDHPVNVTATLGYPLFTAESGDAYVRVVLGALNPRLAIEPAELYWNASVAADEWKTPRQFAARARRRARRLRRGQCHG